MTTYTRANGESVSGQRSGDTPLRWWLMVTLAGLLTVGVMGWMTTMQASVSANAVDTAGLQQSSTDVVRRLDSIDTKLDTLLGWQRR